VQRLFVKRPEWTLGIPDHDPCPYCGSYEIDMSIGGVVVCGRVCNVWHCNACGMSFDEVDDVE